MINHEIMNEVPIAMIQTTRLRRLLLALALLVVGACGAPSAQTLEGALVQPGDLPAEIAAAPVSELLPERLTGVNPPERGVFQQFSRGGKSDGGVAVLIYGDDATRDAAYSYLLAGMGASQPLAGVGERADGIGPEATLLFSEVLWARCRAVVQLRLLDAPLADATALAQKLDARLQGVAC
jgi:hypothetical protein